MFKQAIDPIQEIATQMSTKGSSNRDSKDQMAGEIIASGKGGYELPGSIVSNLQDSADRPFEVMVIKLAFPSIPNINRHFIASSCSFRNSSELAIAPGPDLACRAGSASIAP